jgi:hypothetical protein
MSMSLDAAVGVLIGGTTIVALCPQRLIGLRIAAIGASLLIGAYAWRRGLLPVLSPLSILTPVNILRLATAMTSTEKQPAVSPRELSRQQAINAFLRECIKARRLP